jgi:hypothetical protein
MGGELQITSTATQGTFATFVIDLPTAKAKQESR